VRADFLCFLCSAPHECRRVFLLERQEWQRRGRGKPGGVRRSPRDGPWKNLPGVGRRLQGSGGAITSCEGSNILAQKGHGETVLDASTPRRTTRTVIGEFSSSRTSRGNARECRATWLGACSSVPAFRPLRPPGAIGVRRWRWGLRWRGQCDLVGVWFFRSCLAGLC